MTDAEPLDIKKIMEKIKKNTSNEIKFDYKSEKKDLKSFLSKLVESREKSSEYLKIKNNLSKNEVKHVESEWQELDHNLYLTNMNVEINQNQPILTNRNRFVRSIILKIRNTIQSEIRFTLNPIIRNQVSFNAFSTKSLNEIKNILKIHHTDIFPDLNWKYLEFENKFRGNEEEIKKRLEKYIPFIQKAKIHSKSELVLDIGSGRGEFLELLTDHKIHNTGIETNYTMYEFNKSRNHNIINKDANAHLLSIEDESLLGITAFQVIEHLSPGYLLNFLKLSFQKISHDGLVIFETVNPMSFYSFSHFWYDFSHRKPIPSDVLKFFVEEAGFKDVEIIFSSNVQEHIALKETDENMKKLNQILFGPQDYAVVGWKK